MNVKDLCDYELDGSYTYATWRKNATSMTTTANAWYDMSWFYGFNQFTTPLTSHALTNGGFYIGPNAPHKKYLRSTTIISVSVAPVIFLLCDYLMCYPLLQENINTPQILINTEPLPRYTDGVGVKIMLVSGTNTRIGGSTITITYTNEQGISGRTAVSAPTNTAVGFGNIITTQAVVGVGNNSVFLVLEDGDTGVRSVQTVTVSPVDIGTFNVVLIKPLATTQLRGIDAPVEKDYFLESATIPEIKNGACLDWVVSSTVSLATGIFTGDLKVINT